MTAPAPALDHGDTFGIDSAVYHRRWLILAVLCISLLLVVTAVSSLNTALPTIQNRLGASGTQLQWIIDAYALVFAGLLLPAGALGDRFGRRGALQFGLVVFAGAAFIASRSNNASQLIAMRAVLGVGAAFIMPATLSIILSSFPFHERPKAIAIWSAFAGVGAAFGPVTSGLLLRHFWWGSVFFINIPLVLLLLVLSTIVLPTGKNPIGHPLDPIGALLSVVGLVTLVFGIIEGPDRGWSDVFTVGAFVVAVVALVGFVLYELRASTPMLDPRLFLIKGFSAGSAGVTSVFVIMFAMFFLLSQYLQFVKDYDALGAGLRIVPSALMFFVMAPWIPMLIKRVGIRRLVRTGFLLDCVGLVLLASADASTGYPLILLATMVFAVGNSIIMPGCSQHIVGSLPLSKAGVGSAMNDVTREVGGAIGIAVAGSIASTVYRSHTAFADRIADASGRVAAKESVGKAKGVLGQLFDTGAIDRSLYEELRRGASKAFTDGIRASFVVLSVVAVAASVLVGRFIPDELPKHLVAEKH
jgi:EmrB/QacA subfamily drug resistance transporter